ncbi:hypothetical protein ACHAWU_000652 [Discostella pseudostelligera]|uniref:Ubiquitin carboxyl-terminal hydrolase n=1 Tax=Discostella pseudostelligera TaxID=259834 RepID=A0ABD3M8X6_9STRA
MARRKQLKSIKRRRKNRLGLGLGASSSTTAAAAALQAERAGVVVVIGDSRISSLHDPPTSSNSQQLTAVPSGMIDHHLPLPLSLSSSSLEFECRSSVASQRQGQGDDDDADATSISSHSLRRCSNNSTAIITRHHRHSHRRHRRTTETSTNCPSLLILPPPPPLTTTTTTTTLPLAAYQPASLFMMLLVASVLPKNTFSLRWLALSGVGVGSGVGVRAMGGGGGRNHLLNYPAAAAAWMRMRGGGSVFGECCGMSQIVSGRRKKKLISWLVFLDGGEEAAAAIAQEDVVANCEFWNSKVIQSLWEDVVAATSLETRTKIIADASSTAVEESHTDWSIDSILHRIPRGGDSRDGGSGMNDHGKVYPGLVNLGNTCYLNAQLQCAYHVPYLRKLVLDADDEVVREEVEVEVEVEIEVDDKEEVDIADDNHQATIDTQVNNDETNLEIDLGSESPVAEEVVNDDSDKPILHRKTKTIVRKEMKETTVPISHALRALKVTFNSLHNNPSSSGSTTILCRTLGINPYLQQDGQEFWKLFIPEIDYNNLARLYSGYYEDYVREILPESETTMNDEMVVTSDDYGEEKKDDGEFESMSLSRGVARERKRIEPFLDLSIPVAEATSGSVEATLREMFTQPEILRVSEGNGWRPSKGDEKVDAYKGASLKRDGLPSLLQLHLKRFKYDYETEETSKINDRCSFPMELDLSEIISVIDRDGEDDEVAGDMMYDLQSIVVHKGEYGSGHYYSYVRPEIRKNEWYRFDDEFVTKVDWADIVADAYGGSRSSRQERSISVRTIDAPKSLPRGIFWPIFALLRLIRRATIIGSNIAPGGGCGFGYGGKSSNAYMLQYVRRSDIPVLYLEE